MSNRIVHYSWSDGEVTVKVMDIMYKAFYRKKAQLELLKDLQGSPYKFYRGKGYDYIFAGCFFCSCFDVAKSYRLYDESPIIETEIAVRKPLVIDATTRENGYSSYGYLYVCDCKLYPEEKRKDLVKYIKEVGGSDTLSTDDVLQWAIRTKDIDAVIIKNVREGNASDLPIYDVMIWNEENLVNQRDVVNAEDEFETFRENTFKRVDLSRYISEKEQDGIVSITEEDDYFVEHTVQQGIRRGKIEWYVGHDLVVNTDVPIKIYCLDIGRYVTVEQLELGVYENTCGVTTNKECAPYNGRVRVKGMIQNWKYKIERNNIFKS